MGARAGEGQAYGNLGYVYYSLGDFSKAIEYHSQRLAIAKEVGDRAGEGGAYGNLGNAYCSLGDFSKAFEYHARCPGGCKGGGRPGGGGQLIREPQQRV